VEGAGGGEAGWLKSPVAVFREIIHGLSWSSKEAASGKSRRQNRLSNRSPAEEPPRDDCGLLS
jgi:hypothetical protein